MKKSIYLLCAVFIICTSAFVLLTDHWRVKGNEASVSFSAGKINGSFTGLKASILFDKDHPEQSKISAAIDAPSIATGFFLKNSHAKDALGVDKYPTIKFVSASVSKINGAYLAKGNLTMKGVTKPVTIHFTFTDKGSSGVFKGDFKVIPKEFGINRDGTPASVLVNLVVPVNKS
jgi:polyisoprenoid-binding protein YceI